MKTSLCSLACSRRGLVWVVAVLAGVGGVAAGQRVTAPVPAAVTRDLDPGLMTVIDGIKAVDNHAHPVLPPPNDKADREFDALPVDNMEAETDTVAWRTDNPQLPEAWKALWGFDGKVPLDEAGMKGLNAARERVKAAKGTGYAAWVLDEAGVGTMLGNRVAMGPGVMRPRFEWVPYADALLLPLDTSGLAKGSPDKALFYPMEDALRGKYLKALGTGAVPGTLSEYLAKVVTPTLERQRAGGAVAEKFEVAYLRGFDFTVVTQERAAALYAKGALSASEYKELQDFLFRYIATECGRLGMAVHLHVMAGGGGYFGVAGADPLLLEPLFNDPALRKTKFVMLHGGWPFVREAGALLQKPNVYLDLSQEALTFSPRTLSGWLREWLETYPEKVMYGTDGYPLSDAMGWEEATWIADRNVRLALGLALTGMLRDGEVTRERAEVIATEVLRGTAVGVYGLR